MRAATDECRRITLPETFPANSAVTMLQLDQDTWIVTRKEVGEDISYIAFPRIENLPEDPEWDATEGRIVKEISRKIPPFEE